MLAIILGNLHFFLRSACESGVLQGAACQVPVLVPKEVAGGVLAFGFFLQTLRLRRATSLLRCLAASAMVAGPACDQALARLQVLTPVEELCAVLGVRPQPVVRSALMAAASCVGIAGLLQKIAAGPSPKVKTT